jgi:hypothetical protein
VFLFDLLCAHSLLPPLQTQIWEEDNIADEVYLSPALIKAWDRGDVESATMTWPLQSGNEKRLNILSLGLSIG